MAEASEYTFSHAEVAAAMLKEAGIREGKWILAVNFGLAAGITGPSEETAVPSAFVGVTGFALVRADPASPQALVVDAAEVSRPRTKRRSKKGLEEA